MLFGNNLRSSYLAAGAFLLLTIALLALLALPLTAAIGPFYWDTVLYYDAAQRIAGGQIPVVDFRTPVGPLSYWMFYVLYSIFPDGQGVYLATWSKLLMTAPLMALIVFDTMRRSPILTAALAIPFFIFSVLPFNVEQFYPFPGIDGYGIYNRQISQLLYVLVAGLLFLETRSLRILVVASCVTGLFLLKITGFLVAIPLLVLALIAGRLSLKQAGSVGAIFVLVLCALQVWSGLSLAYVESIISLIELNEGSLALHFIHGAARNITMIAGLGLLILALVWAARQEIAIVGSRLTKGAAWHGISKLAAMPLFWIIATSFAGVALESQNWGGQALFFVWPAIVACLMAWEQWPQRTQLVVTVLISISILPPYASLAGRGLRTYMAQLQYDPVEISGLGTLGQISKRAGIDKRVELIRATSVNNPGYYQRYIDEGELPFFNYYAQPEFQLAWLESIGEGVLAIRAYEKKHGIRFETILNLNFANPFPYLLDRQAPRLVTIGKDPFRTLPPIDQLAITEIEATDLILWPKCPATIANQKIREHFGPLVQSRKTIALSPCWDGLVDPDETATALPAALPPDLHSWRQLSAAGPERHQLPSVMRQ